MSAMIHDGSIVRITGRSGDWRVLPGRGMTLGTHLPTVHLEAVGEAWIHDRTEPLASVYAAPLLDLKRGL